MASYYYGITVYYYYSYSTNLLLLLPFNNTLTHPNSVNIVLTRAHRGLVLCHRPWCTRCHVFVTRPPLSLEHASADQAGPGTTYILEEDSQVAPTPCQEGSESRLQRFAANTGCERAGSNREGVQDTPIASSRSRWGSF